MKLGDITKNYGDEKIEIQKHIVDAGNKSDNKKSKEKSNTSALSGIFDLKNKITKYMFMPFEVLNEVLMPKSGSSIKDTDAIEKSIIQKCSGKKNKRKCIKRAIRKTCRNKGNQKTKCKRTLKNKLLN